MPTRPTKTKNAIQEIARVFNRLASELTSDLNHAVKEIESLKREVQKLKNISQRNTKSSSPTRRNTTTRSPRTPRSTPNTTRTTHISTADTTHETHHETTPGSQPSFVFPSESFNPPSPSEPSGHDNN